MYLNTDGVIILYSLHVFQQLLRDDTFMQKNFCHFKINTVNTGI